MNKIKILEIIGDSSLAGAPRHLLSILEHLDRHKFDLHCICPPGPLAGEIRKVHPHVNLEVIRMPSRLNWQAIKKIRKTIRFLKPDVIHAHGTRGGVLGRLAAIGTNPPVIYTEHLWTREFRLGNRFLDFLHYNANWFLDLFTTLNIAVSNATRDFLIQSHISYPEKIKVIYNGILPPHHFAKPFENPQEFLLITVATLNKNKGIQYLLKAMPRLMHEFPGIQLQIIGDGEYRRPLQNLTRKLKLTNFVKFMGFLPNVEKTLSQGDLYIQPSLSESFGLAILQAMSVGLPVVATTTGGIPEVVTQDKTGLLVPPGSGEKLAEAIIDLLRDPARGKKMGEMAKRDAAIRFNLKDMIIALETTYEELAKNSSFPK